MLLGIKKISSLMAISAGILLFGGYSAHAESSYNLVKERIEKDHVSGKAGKIEAFEGSSLDALMKSPTTKSLLQTSKGTNGYTTDELTGNYRYEIEPNNYYFEADFLPQGDIMFGTFWQEDVDTFEIYVPETSYIGISGIMPSYSLSNIGFVLADEYDYFIEENELQFGDHQMTAGYYLTEGTYYIYAINTGSHVTSDEYGLAWDILEAGDTTPPPVPKVDRIDDNDTLLTGTAEPNSTIEVSVEGTVIATGFANPDGRYEVDLPSAYPTGTILSVTAIDQAGNRSAVSYVTVVSSTFTGWVTEDGKRYHYSKGLKDKGWYSENGKDYFLDTSTGAVKTGWIYFNSKWYFFDRNTGVKKTGWLLDGKWYYLDSSGVMQTGWEKVGTTWYYLKSNGIMATGWIKDGYSWYYLAGNGAMKTGWVKDGGSWYYLASNGAMKTGWIKDGTKWYYLYSSGKMAYSTKIGKYKLGANGAWIQ
jgi:glucan-binding YG repeat protein